MSEASSAAAQIRVLFISHTAEWVGPTRSLFLLLKHLDASLLPAVVVPEAGAFAERVSELGVRVHRLPTLTKWSIPRLVRLIRRQRIELVYANNTHGSSRVAWVAARMSRVPFVTHVRGMAWDRTWLRMGYLGWTDRVVAVSRACAESVMRFTRSVSLEVVHNGVELSDDDSRVQGRSESAGPTILSLSHICARKGQLHAVEAFRTVHAEFPHARLVLAGRLDREPDYVRKVKDRVEEYALRESVSLPGFSPDIDGRLAEADVLLHTALADPHPRAVVEAMAAGLPVVAFATDGVAETVVSEVTGRLVPTGDTPALSQALSDVLRDEPEARRMGREGRNRALALFSAAGTAREVSRIVREVVAGRTAR